MASLWSQQLRASKQGDLPRLEAEVLAARPWTRPGASSRITADSMTGALAERPWTGPAGRSMLSTMSDSDNRPWTVSCSQAMSASLKSMCGNGARPNPRRGMPAHLSGSGTSPGRGRHGNASLNHSTSSCGTPFRKTRQRHLQSSTKSDMHEQWALPPPWQDLRCFLASGSQAYAGEVLQRTPGALQLYGPLHKIDGRRDSPRSPRTPRRGYEIAADLQSISSGSWKTVAPTSQVSALQTTPNKVNTSQEHNSCQLLDITIGSSNPGDTLRANCENDHEVYCCTAQEPILPKIELLEQAISCPCTATLRLSSFSDEASQQVGKEIDLSETMKQKKLPSIDDGRKCDSQSKNVVNPLGGDSDNLDASNSPSQSRQSSPDMLNGTITRSNSTLAESVVSKQSEFREAFGLYLPLNEEVKNEEPPEKTSASSDNTPRGRFRSTSGSLYSGNSRGNGKRSFARSLTRSNTRTSEVSSKSKTDAIGGISPKGQTTIAEAPEEKEKDGVDEESVEAKETNALVPHALLDHGPPPILAQLFDNKKRELLENHAYKREAYDRVSFDTLMGVHAKYQKYNLDVWEVILSWEEFVNLDVSGTGYLSFEEFRQGLKRALKLGEGPVPPHLLDKEWRSFQGELDFTSYLEWTVQHAFTEEVLVPDEKDRRIRQLAREMGLMLTTVERIKSVFDKFDTDGSAVIDREEFTQVMGILMKVECPQDIPEKMLDRYWHEVDNNFSGHVDFEEFLHWYTMYFED